MKCHRVRKLLIPFLSGEVSPRTRAAIQQHLDRCADCAAERDLLVESWQMLGSYEVPEVRDDFTSSLMRRVRAEEVPTGVDKIVPMQPAPIHRRWRLTAAAAACLAVALTLGLLWHRSPDLQGGGSRRPPDDAVAMVPLTDEDIIRDLELYENADMLADMDLFSDLDVIEDLDDSLL